MQPKTFNKAISIVIGIIGVYASIFLAMNPIILAGLCAIGLMIVIAESLQNVNFWKMFSLGD